MWKVKVETPGFKGSLQYTDTCPNQPVNSSYAFCEEHCRIANKSGIPTALKEYVSYRSKVCDVKNPDLICIIITCRIMVKPLKWISWNLHSKLVQQNAKVHN